MAELIIILIVFACIAWVVWTEREFKLALKDAGFVEACGIDDPALYGAAALEERKRVAEPTPPIADRAVTLSR
ncbi:MAG: hypothetical protein WB505_04080 [Pseudolabrys sp.]